MTGSKLFADTAPVIYLIEENPKYFEKVSLFLADSIRQNKHLLTSVLTIAEFEIKPKKLNRPEVIAKFNKIIKAAFHVDLITWEIATISAGLRAKYSSLRGYRLIATCLCNQKQLSQFCYQ